MPVSQSFLSAFLLLFICTVAHADDPNAQPVEEALRSSMAAFIGRVIEIEETDHGRLQSEAIARFKVVTPLYGKGVRAGSIVNVHHVSRYYSDKPEPGFSVRFAMSNYYLVTLKSDFLNKDQAYEFSSKASDLSDIAYRVTDYDGSELFTHNKTEHYYQSIYEPGNNEQLELNKLVRWVAR